MELNWCKQSPFGDSECCDRFVGMAYGHQGNSGAAVLPSSVKFTALQLLLCQPHCSWHSKCPHLWEVHRATAFLHRIRSTECSTWTKRAIHAPTVFGQCCQHKLEMSNRLDISPYLLNHLYNYNNPKILTPVPQSVEGVASESIAISQSDTTRGMKQVKIPKPVHKSPGF